MVILAVLPSVHVKLSRSSGSGKVNSQNVVSSFTMKFSALITVYTERTCHDDNHYNSPILSLDIVMTVSLPAKVLAKYRPRSSPFCNSISLPNEELVSCNDFQPATLESLSIIQYIN